MGFSGGAQTRYKKYPCKGSCKRNSYETICENIVSRYQTLVSSLPREAVFLHRRPKTEFITGPPGKEQPSNGVNIGLFHNATPSFRFSKKMPVDKRGKDIAPLWVGQADFSKITERKQKSIKNVNCVFMSGNKSIAILFGKAPGNKQKALRRSTWMDSLVIMICFEHHIFR